jgi:hypothetical protein
MVIDDHNRPIETNEWLTVILMYHSKACLSNHKFNTLSVFLTPIPLGV